MFLTVEWNRCVSC